jgi:hypothetical protein
MKKAIVSVGLLALGAAGVQQAHADMAATDKPWTISGTLRGFYDDNYNTQPNGPNKRSSYGFEVRPSAALSWSSGPDLLTASYAYSAKYYEDKTPYKWDQAHDLEAFWNHNFSERYALDLEESFVDSQEPLALNPSNPASAPLRSNGDNYHNDVGFNFHAQITPLLGLVVGYANNWYEYTGAQTGQLAGVPAYSALLDRFEHAVVLNSRWTIDEDTVGILGYTFGAVKYDNGGSIAIAPTYVASSTRDNYSHDIYVGAEHKFRSDLSVSGRVGVQVLDYYNDPSGNSDSSVSPYVKLNLNYTYMDGGNAVLGFSHSKNQTDQAGIALTGATLAAETQDQESSTVSLTINQVLTPISPDLSVSLNGQYQNSAYNGGSLNNATDNFYLFGLNLTYQFNRYLSSEIGYNYDYLNSQVAGLGYDRNRVYIGVTASY